MTLRLMVTGATGQVASALLEESQGNDSLVVVCLGRDKLDITDAEHVMAAVRQHDPHIIVNAAAYTAVDRAESEPSLAKAVNEEGAYHLARAAVDRNIPLIHLSTDYVFNGRKTTPYREDDATEPLSVYGRTKLAGEQAIGQAGARHIILRTAWVFSHNGLNFVRTMLRLGSERDVVRVVGDQHGNPTYATSIARVIFAVAQRLHADAGNESLYGTFHMAGQGSVSWYDFARAIFEECAAYGKRSPAVEEITTAQYPTAAIRPANSRLDCNKLASVYDIVLPHWRDDLKICIQRMLAQDVSKVEPAHG